MQRRRESGETVSHEVWRVWVICLLSLWGRHGRRSLPVRGRWCSQLCCCRNQSSGIQSLTCGCPKGCRQKDLVCVVNNHHYLLCLVLESKWTYTKSMWILYWRECAGCTSSTVHITNRWWLGPGCYWSWGSRTTFTNYTYAVLTIALFLVATWCNPDVPISSSHLNVYSLIT